jgi:predicted alpha/beta hydrolase family esterase
MDGSNSHLPSMKTSDAEILIVPGYKGANEDHWQSRWERNITSARRVQMGDWHKPVFEDWKANLIEAVSNAQKPVFLVGHSIGSQVIVQAAKEFNHPVKGALLVAPPDVENPDIKPRHLMTFGPASRDPLPFPSVTIASRNDHFCAFEKAEDMAAAWGSLFMDAGESGHINHESGHGPWPEGLMVFSRFLKQIDV